MEDLFEMMTQPTTARRRRAPKEVRYEGESLREALGGSFGRESSWLDLDHALASKPRSAAEEFETEWGGGEEEISSGEPDEPGYDM